MIEVQTGRDGEVFVRISRYILGAAASRTYSEKIDGKDRVCVDLPDMALVYLRPPKNMAAEAELCIRGSGQELIHPIQVLRMDHMTLETMLDRNLLFLVPFYLFRYADKLSEIQDDPQQLEELMAEYQVIATTLAKRVENGTLSKPDRSMLGLLTGEVSDQLAARQDKIREGVTRIMTGELILWRPRDIFRKGRAEGLEEGRAEGHKEGREQGRAEGRREMRDETLHRLIGMGLSDHQIVEAFPDMSLREVETARSQPLPS